MSLEKLLNHFCDIYHIQKEQVSPGFGFASSPSFYYAEQPDIRRQSCHFGIDQNSTVVQTAPANQIEAKIKLTLPVGTDIRINDKIIDCETGAEYTAEQPINVRNHHIFVFIHKVGGEKLL